MAKKERSYEEIVWQARLANVNQQTAALVAAQFVIHSGMSIEDAVDQALEICLEVDRRFEKI